MLYPWTLAVTLPPLWFCLPVSTRDILLEVSRPARYVPLLFIAFQLLRAAPVSTPRGASVAIVAGTIRAQRVPGTDIEGSMRA